MDRKLVNIGLDIGITSVGWSVLDQDFHIIKHGVRLFNSLEVGKTSKLANEQRREKRSMRRQKNRKVTLRRDFIKLLKEQKWIDLKTKDNEAATNIIYNFTDRYINLNNILELRHQGLSNKLTKEELINVLYWYLHIRGFMYTLADDDDKEQKELKKLAKKLKISESTNLEDQLPIKIQYDFFKKNGYYRSAHNRLFANKKYVEEIKYILEKSNVEQSFINKYIDIFFKRQRSFELGPGSKKAYEKMKDKTLISPFSRFSYDKKTKKLSWEENMWDAKIGKCPYDGKERIVKNAFSAQLFNLLIDINNLTLNEQNKVTNEQKEDIIKIALKTSTPTSNAMQTKKYLKTKDIDGVSGFRIDKKKDELITSLINSKTTNLKKINQILEKHNITPFIYKNLSVNKFKNNDVDLIDNIIIALSKSKIIETRKTSLKKIVSWNDEVIDELAKIIIGPGTHPFSKEFINKLLPLLFDSTKNPMKIIHEQNIAPIDYKKMQGRKYIDLKWIDHEYFIASPTTKRALRQSLKVLNKLLKVHKDWKVDNIVIEMARDLNSKAAKESIKSLIKFNEERKKQIEKIVNDKNIVLTPRIMAKIWLYEQQKGRDAYTNESLVLERVIKDYKYTDIDHIIPYSVCFDGSRNNKVLTLATTNSLKGNKQPFQFMSKSNFNKMKNSWNTWYNPENNKENDRKAFSSKKKMINIMTQIDYSDPKNSYGFIERNIVDTRYVTKELLGTLKEFIEGTSKDHTLFKTKVKTINGGFTSYLRKQVERKGKLIRPEEIEDGSFDKKTNQKIRVWNGHHAEDATLVIFGALKNPQLNKYIEKVISNPFMKQKDINEFTEKNNIDDSWKENTVNPQFILDELNRNMNNVYFSYMINKKRNVELFKKLIYGGRLSSDKKKVRKVRKIKLSELDKKKAQKFFSNDYKYEILMKTYDKKTWNKIVNIYNNGSNEKPFDDCLDSKRRLTIEKIKDKNGEIIKRKIGSFKVLYEEKEVKNVVRNTHKRIKDNKMSFKDNLNWVEIHWFKLQNGKNLIIPINSLTAKIDKGFKSDNKNSYKPYYFEILKENNLNFRNRICSLYYGTIIENSEGKLFKIVSLEAKKGTLKLKPISAKAKEKSYTINKKIKHWKVIQLDSIGQKFSNKKMTF